MHALDYYYTKPTLLHVYYLTFDLQTLYPHGYHNIAVIDVVI